MPALKGSLKPADLLKFRTERHLTWQAMADLFGVSLSCYAHWERGESPVSKHAEQTVKNWKVMVLMGEALANEGRMDYLESLNLSPVLMAEIAWRMKA